MNPCQAISYYSALLLHVFSLASPSGEPASCDEWDAGMDGKDELPGKNIKSLISDFDARVEEVCHIYSNSWPEFICYTYALFLPLGSSIIRSKRF